MSIQLLVTAAGIALISYSIAALMIRRYFLLDTDSQITAGLSLFVKTSRLVGLGIVDTFPVLTQKKIKKDGDLIIKGGFDYLLRASDIIGMQIIGTVSLAIVSILLFPNHLILALLGGCILGYILPRRFVISKKNKRQEELARDFPLALDMISVGVAGGLSLAAALKEVVKNWSEGPVKYEISRINRDLQMNYPLKNALRRFKDRVDVMEIKSVSASLVQSVEVGSGILDTLETQSEQLRYNRLMRAEEQANKAPTKMMLPLVVFILPCFFLIIFTPLIMSVISSFKGVM